MCTAITLKTKDFYFGRTLDNDFSYGEEVVITPRSFIEFRSLNGLKNRFAIIGTAFVKNNYPLYYDAVNEKGLCMAGLNFVGNAHYNAVKEGKSNVAQFEFISYILGNCTCVSEAVEEIKKINLTNESYCEGLPPAELHWIIADRESAVTVEFVLDGLKIYKNRVGVLTNNPPFEQQVFNLNNYMRLSASEINNTFSKKLRLKSYSRGMGALGLPGDLSSQSRFVRAAFFSLNSVSGDSEEESVNRFFHILGTVAQPRGACKVGKNGYEITVYSSCCNADKGVYYYISYGNHRISAVDMHRCDLDGDKLFRTCVNSGEDILFIN